MSQNYTRIHSNNMNANNISVQYLLEFLIYESLVKITSRTSEKVNRDRHVLEKFVHNMKSRWDVHEEFKSTHTRLFRGKNKKHISP